MSICRDLNFEYDNKTVREHQTFLRNNILQNNKEIDLKNILPLGYDEEKAFMLFYPWEYYFPCGEASFNLYERNSFVLSLLCSLRIKPNSFLPLFHLLQYCEWRYLDSFDKESWTRIIQKLKQIIYENWKLSEDDLFQLKHGTGISNENAQALRQHLQSFPLPLREELEYLLKSQDYIYKCFPTARLSKQATNPEILSNLMDGEFANAFFTMATKAATKKEDKKTYLIKAISYGMVSAYSKLKLEFPNLTSKERDDCLNQIALYSVADQKLELALESKEDKSGSIIKNYSEAGRLGYSYLLHKYKLTPQSKELIEKQLKIIDKEEIELLNFI
jgi:hypothetical protein